MQKIFLCSCIVIALLLHMPVQRASLSFLMGEYTFYSTQMQSFDGCEVVKNGNFYHISCDSTLAKTLNVKKVVGQSVKFAGNCDDFYSICKKLGKIKKAKNCQTLIPLLCHYKIRDALMKVWSFIIRWPLKIQVFMMIWQKCK